LDLWTWTWTWREEKRQLFVGAVGDKLVWEYVRLRWAGLEIRWVHPGAQASPAAQLVCLDGGVLPIFTQTKSYNARSQRKPATPAYD
jgi:hypothetical protein